MNLHFDLLFLSGPLISKRFQPSVVQQLNRPQLPLIRPKAQQPEERLDLRPGQGGRGHSDLPALGEAVEPVKQIVRVLG